MMKSKSFASSLLEEQRGKSETSTGTVSSESAIPFEMLNPTRAESMEEQDERIDLSEIPEITAEQAARAVRGFRPVSKQQVTLWLDDEVLPWLQALNERSFRSVNHILRREMQYQEKQKRAAISEKSASALQSAQLTKAS